MSLLVALVKWTVEHAPKKFFNAVGRGLVPVISSNEWEKQHCTSMRKLDGGKQILFVLIVGVSAAAG